MDEKTKKELEELKTQVISLRIRVKRLEDFYNAFPDPSEYLYEHDYGPGGRDELFEQTVRMVAQHDRASASLIQRRMQIGFNRAARLLEQLEEAGVIGKADGSKPRDVLVRKDVDEFLKNLDDDN